MAIAIDHFDGVSLLLKRKRKNNDVWQFMTLCHPSFCTKLHWSNPLLICTERFLHILPSMDSDWINLEPAAPIGHCAALIDGQDEDIFYKEDHRPSFIQSVISNSSPTCPWSSCIWRWAFAYPGVCKVLTFAQSFSSNVCADFKSRS